MSASLMAFMLGKQLIVTIQRHSNRPDQEMLGLLQHRHREEREGVPAASWELH